jgi:hypothetical protein
MYLATDAGPSSGPAFVVARNKDVGEIVEY